MNNILLVGNLTKDPKLVTSGKTDRAVFTIAVNEKFGAEGEERTHFANCTAWGTLATNMAESLSKGDRVVAAARLSTYGKEVQVDGDDVNLTMTSFTVTAIGPELRFAQADVSKVSVARQDAGKDDDDEEDEEEEAPKPKSKVKSKSKSKAPVDDDEDDDEF